MISLKIGAIVAAAFVAGAFVSSPVPQAIAAVIATDVQCTGCVGTSDIAGNAVTSPKIKDGDVKAGDLGFAAVTNPKIANGAVNSAKVADGSMIYADLSRSFVRIEHRDDCNCGGTGWDPDGVAHFGIIYDDGITRNSVVVASVLKDLIVCSANGPVVGSFVVACDRAIPNDVGINYAIINK